MGALVGAVATLSVVDLLIRDEQQEEEKKSSIVPQEQELLHEAIRYGVPSMQNVKIRQGYALGYDRRLRNAAWVAEYITKESLEKNGDVNRLKSSFKVDPTTPTAFRVTPAEYQNSGYDRGHLAPARDMNSSQPAINESFLMTNISPQVSKFNRGYWSRLEGFVRHLANYYGAAYVITGPLFLPQKTKEGDGYTVSYPIIGTPLNGIAVPTHFFKVILIEKKGKKGQKLKYLATGFVLPNQGIADKIPLSSFVMPLDMIERYSGLVFFDKLERPSLLPLCDDTKCELKAIEFQKQVKAIE
ncbi:hypothetical protein THRCLA_03862 [Thraustotheca clavata]|uniref:Endonuclease n=1 Tax=Thraustotheca clavata TaxID=74557 RepID=A0A1W0A0R4_9STRA|nr:hypothetical protein THRCLA_03862 [Thraustotheca clavata]